MNITTRDIDDLIGHFRKDGTKGKQMEIMSTLRKQIRNDHEIQRLLRDERDVEHFLSEVYPNVLPIKAKEHFMQNVSKINKHLEELFQQGKNPKAIGINSEGYGFDHLKIDMQKEQLRRQERKQAHHEQQMEEVQESVIQLRRQMNQEENKRKIALERIEMTVQELSILRREVEKLQKALEQTTQDIENAIKPIREHTKEFEWLLSNMHRIRSWVNDRPAFRAVRRVHRWVERNS